MMKKLLFSYQTQKKSLNAKVLYTIKLNQHKALLVENVRIFRSKINL